MNANMSAQPVDATYGSPMGRASCYPALQEVAAGSKFSLHQVQLNQGGYDSGGAYWGTGQRLYYAAVETIQGKECSWYFRAVDRVKAKAIIRQQFPGARFYQ